LDVSLGLVVTRKVRLQGITVESRVGMEAMLRAISQHAMKPVIDQTFAFGKLREALDYRALSVQFGNVCIQH
jgi:D-arabinose 1-dehydrogenase-like Zn-dependent alcohol dehydrogenase